VTLAGVGSTAWLGSFFISDFMATILRLIYSPDAHLSLREKARAILDMRSNDTPITITDSELLREIERVNLEEYECKLSVEYRMGEDVRNSHGYSLNEELGSILPNVKDEP
jgi:hypothetical protein